MSLACLNLCREYQICQKPKTADWDVFYCPSSLLDSPAFPLSPPKTWTELNLSLDCCCPISISWCRKGRVVPTQNLNCESPKCNKTDTGITRLESYTCMRTNRRSSHPRMSYRRHSMYFHKTNKIVVH